MKSRPTILIETVGSGDSSSFWVPPTPPPAIRPGASPRRRVCETEPGEGGGIPLPFRHKGGWSPPSGFFSRGEVGGVPPLFRVATKGPCEEASAPGFVWSHAGERKRGRWRNQGRKAGSYVPRGVVTPRPIGHRVGGSDRFCGKREGGLAGDPCPRNHKRACQGMIPRTGSHAGLLRGSYRP